MFKTLPGGPGVPVGVLLLGHSVDSVVDAIH